MHNTTRFIKISLLPKIGLHITLAEGKNPKALEKKAMQYYGQGI